MNDSAAMHFHLSTGVVATRVFKEAKSVLNQKIFSKVVYVGLWESGLEEQEAHSSGLDIIRVKTLLRALQSNGYFQKRTALRRVLAFFSFIEWCFKAIILALKIHPKFIVCHNVVLLPVAYIATLISRTKLVYMPHELESEASFLSASKKKIYKLIEILFSRNCHTVVAVNEPILQWYKDEIKIKNGYSLRNIPEFVELNDRSKALRNKFSISNDDIIFLYQGLLGCDRGIDNLIRVFEQVPTKHMMFMGYGEMQMSVIEASSRCSNIHFNSAVPMNELLKTTSSADIGVIFVVGNLPLSYRLSLPNKFFEYIHAGLPVVVSKDLTYLAELVTTNRLGWVADSDSVLDLVANIGKSDICRYVENVQKYAKENLWSEEEKLFLEIYK